MHEVVLIVHCTGLPHKLRNPTAAQHTHHRPSSSICAATYVTVSAVQLLLAHTKLWQHQAATKLPAFILELWYPYATLFLAQP